MCVCAYVVGIYLYLCMCVCGSVWTRVPVYKTDRHINIVSSPEGYAACGGENMFPLFVALRKLCETMVFPQKFCNLKKKIVKNN